MLSYEFLVPPSRPSPKGEGDHPVKAGQKRGLVNNKVFKIC